MELSEQLLRQNIKRQIYELRTKHKKAALFMVLDGQVPDLDGSDGIVEHVEDLIENPCACREQLLSLIHI